MILVELRQAMDVLKGRLNRRLAPRYRVEKSNFNHTFLPLYRRFIEPRFLVQFPVHLPFAIPLQDGRTLTLPNDGDSLLSYVFSSREVDVSSIINPGTLGANPLRRSVKLTRVEMIYATCADLPEDHGEVLSPTFDRLLEELNNIVTAYRVLFKDPDAVRLTRQMLQPMCMWRVVDTRSWSSEDGIFILHSNTPYNRKQLSDEEVRLLAWHTTVSGQGYNPFSTCIELQLDAQRELIKGYHRDAVIHAQTAVEAFLTQLLNQMLLCEGMSEVDAAMKLKTIGFIPVVRREFHRRLGGVWDTSRGATPVGDWYSNCYGLRNAVVHSGYSPKFAESNQALSASNTLIGYVIDLLNSTVGCYDSIKHYFTDPQAPPPADL